MRNINEIVVHCTATRPDWWSDRSTEEKAREVRQWHLDRGWKDIGYHWLIDRDGTVVKGRDESVLGRIVKDHRQPQHRGQPVGGPWAAAMTTKFQD